MKGPLLRISSLAALGCIVALTACASGGTGTRSSSGTITRAELDAVNAFSVDEAIELLRPTWAINLQGACYAEQAMDREALRSLPLHQVEQIRKVSASEAAARCGAGGTGMMASGDYLLITRLR
jgi:hypothetical protein